MSCQPAIVELGLTLILIRGLLGLSWLHSEGASGNCGIVPAGFSPTDAYMTPSIDAADKATWGGVFGQSGDKVSAISSSQLMAMCNSSSNSNASDADDTGSAVGTVGGVLRLKTVSGEDTDEHPQKSDAALDSSRCVAPWTALMYERSTADGCSMSRAIKSTLFPTSSMGSGTKTGTSTEELQETPTAIRLVV